MSVSTSSNPQDTARLVLEMDSNKSSTNSQIDLNNNIDNENMEIDNNNDKIDPNLKFVDNESKQGENEDDDNEIIGKEKEEKEEEEEEEEDGKHSETKKLDEHDENVNNDNQDGEIINNKLDEKEKEKDKEKDKAEVEVIDKENETNNKDSDGDQIMNDSIDNNKDSKIITKQNDEIKKTKLFYSNIKNLTDIISDTLNEISIIIPKIYDKNSILNSYLCNIEKSDKIETFSNFMSGVEKFENDSKQLLNSDNKDKNNKDNKDKKDINDNNIKIERLSLHERARAARLYHEKNHPSCIEGTGIPEIDLNNQAKTVKDIWNEWIYGFKNRPSLQSLERKFGTRWRRGRIAKSAQRRKKVIEFIENEFKRHELILHDPLKVVNDLDNYRILKGKGLFWLYGSLPDRLYDDAGNPLYKIENESNDSSNIINKNTEIELNKINDSKDSKDLEDSKINNKLEESDDNNKKLENESISKISKDSEINKDENVDKTEKEKEEKNEIKSDVEKEVQKENEKEESEIIEKEQINNDKIDDNLKAIDSKSINETENDSKKDLINNKKLNDKMEIDNDSNNLNEKSKTIPNEEEEEIEDMDEEEEDDVMPSVADVAAMASMSVEGEDDEHALVNSAALAVAAQHVANQQRLRDRQKSSTKSQNDNEEGDINNYISTEDSLNESTDPALSKL